MNKVISGINDFPTTNPELLIQWDYEKNDVDPTKVSKGSDTKRWWLCEEFRHSHLVSVSAKTKSKPTKCTVCKGRQVLPGFNDLDTKFPDVSAEWDYDKNDEVPTNVTARNHNLYWWKCKNHDHSYQATCNDKTKESRPGCPYCFGNKVLVGFNDVATTDPDESVYMVSPDPTTVSRGHKGVGTFKCKKEDHTYSCLVRDKFVASLSCPICYGRRVEEGFNSLADTDPDVTAEWDYDLNTLLPSEITRGSNKKVWLRCTSCGKSYFDDLYKRTLNGLGCRDCGGTSSQGEKDLSVFVSEELGLEITKGSRKLIPPYELDIFIPSLNTAIEYNGIFFHSEYYKDKNYHKMKHDLCQSKGIRLIQVWEDDWKTKRNLVETLLRHKLGLSKQESVYARKTDVKEIGPKQAKDFLDTNHIQGSATGSIRLGLFSKSTDELVAVTVLKNTAGTLRLERYATSKRVVGGQSKFLKYIDNNMEYKKLVTFADLSISDGGLYDSTGWVFDKLLDPDYRYLYRGKLYHKFNFRVSRFEKDPELKFEEGMSERDLSALNGLLRVYDSGKIRYVRHNPTT